MALLAGHLTKLQAVNDMLGTIGEDPVNSLSSGLPDAELAESILDRVSREIQLEGWHCNTREDVELSINVDDQFALPDNTLKVDTVNPRGPRKNRTPSPHSYINVSMRRSSDDTKWLLYDVDNDSETWTDAGLNELTVDIVQLLEFANLTPALQMYVWTAASRRFQQNVMGSQALDQFTAEDVASARTKAINEEYENSDDNVIRDNTHVYDIVYRYNPHFGR